MSSTCRTIPPKQRGKAASDGKVPVQGDEAPTKKRRRSSAAPGAELTAIHRQIKAQQATQQQLMAKLRKAQNDLDTWRAQVDHIHSQWEDTQAKNACLRADNAALRAAIASQQAAANRRGAPSSNTSPPAAGVANALQLPPPVPWALQVNCPSPTYNGFLLGTPAASPAAAAAAGRASGDSSAAGIGHSNNRMCQGANSTTSSQAVLLVASGWHSPPQSPADIAAAAAAAAAAAGGAAPQLVRVHSTTAGSGSWGYGDEGPMQMHTPQTEVAGDTWSSGQDSWASNVWHGASHTSQEVAGHPDWQAQVQVGVARSCGSSDSAACGDQDVEGALPNALSNVSSRTAAQAGGGVSPSADPLDLLLADDTCWGSESLEELMGLLGEDGGHSAPMYLPAKQQAAAGMPQALPLAGTDPCVPVTQGQPQAAACEFAPLHLAACDWRL